MCNWAKSGKVSIHFRAVSARTLSVRACASAACRRTWRRRSAPDWTWAVPPPCAELCWTLGAFFVAPLVPPTRARSAPLLPPDVSPLPLVTCNTQHHNLPLYLQVSGVSLVRGVPLLQADPHCSRVIRKSDNCSIILSWFVNVTKLVLSRCHVTWKFNFR